MVNFQVIYAWNSQKEPSTKNNNKEHDNIRGDYKTRTKCSKDSDHRCTFVLNVACRKIDSRWLIRPLPIARQR